MFRRIISAIFIAIIVSNQLVTTAQATPEYDEMFYSGNDILFYDPRCDTSMTRGEILSLNGDSNIDKIMNFLIAPAQGLSVAQAAGVIGNFMAESGNGKQIEVEVEGEKKKINDVNPAAIQGGGNADPDYVPVNGVGFGIAQWTFTARQQPLVNYMRPYGDITSIDGQIGFMWQELNGSHASSLRKLKETTTFHEANYIFHKFYEGSADSAEQVRVNRGGKAELVYKLYANQNVPSAESDSATSSEGDIHATRDTGTNRTGTQSCTATEGGEDLIGLVQQYAWPEYKSPGGEGIIPTDKYRQAVDTAISNRRYVGGTLYKGIDCGGFVTTLIIDSKFDPGYNNGSELAKGAGNTIAQEAWLRKNWRVISSSDATDRQPGDVAINETHTYIYVGPDAFPNKVPIASASWDERAPMQGREAVADSSFRWYRINSAPPATSGGGS